MPAVAAALLASVVCPAADAPPAAAAPWRLLPLDIGYAVNRTHAAAPYYDGQVANYAWLTPGERTVTVGDTAVPFRVLDPGRNSGRSVFVSKGQRNDFPVSTAVYPYAVGVRRVYLFGLAAGWGSGEAGAEVATVTLRFADGRELRQPLRLGTEVDNWIGHTAAGVTRVAAEQPNGGGAHLDALAIDVPSALAGVTLTDIRLTVAEAAGVAVPLFGVTLAVDRDPGPVAAARLATADLARAATAAQGLVRRVTELGFEPAAAATAGVITAAAQLAGRQPPPSLADALAARLALDRATDELTPLLSRRRFTKVPDPTRPDFPTAADYMAILERYPLWAERGWHDRYLDNPDLGYFGEGGNNENSLRTLGNFIFTYALLASDPAYDPSVSGVDPALLLARARAALRYMTRSHVTGDLDCARGKRWGNHWQSAWWTSRMVAGARLIWDRLSAEERAAVDRVVIHEADRHLDRKVPGEVFRNTRSEENAWDSEIITWAACLYPQHEHAKAWADKAREFYLNTLSVEADKTDATPVDGRPVRDQVYTVNVHPDFTIENHGAYQFCYMACPLHSLAWDYYAYTSTGNRPPQALFHHYRDVFDVIRRTHLYDGRFAYLGGKDWARYVYGLYFVMPALVVMQDEFGDRDARLFEALRVRTFEWEQRQHGDGGLFSGRFTRNVMSGWPSEYETDGAALLALCYRLHQGRPTVTPTPAAEFQERVAGVHVSAGSEWAMARTPEAFASFSWRMLDGRHSMGLFVPAGGDDLVEWGVNNLIGRFDVRGVDMDKRTFRHRDVPGERQFTTTGQIDWGRREQAVAVTQHLSFTALPAQGLAVLIDWSVAASDLTLTAQRGLTLHLANDLFNGNVRHLAWSGGQADVRGVGGTPGTLATAGRWLSVDDRLGIICPNGGTATVQDAAQRNAPWGSLLYELVCWPDVATPQDAKAGQTLRDQVFVFTACDRQTTERVAASVTPLATGLDACRAVYLATPAGGHLLVAANFAATKAQPQLHVAPETARALSAAGVPPGGDGAACLDLEPESTRAILLP